MKKLLFAFLLTGLLACSQKQSIEKYPEPVALSDISIEGEMKQRVEANFSRLHRGRYVPDSIYLVPNPEYHQTRWPGDVPGRLVLAITLMEQATHQKSPNLDEIITDFQNHMNHRGYFGKDYGDMLNEQQLSSHGWVLRGLSEHYEHTKDEYTLQLLTQMVDSLVIPTMGFHASYPIDPALREDAGEFMGSHSKAIGQWILSTDVGCDFIFMDGVIHAYEILRTDTLQMISKEMIDRFLEADLTAIKAQTHATLTALRAILRYYEITGEKDYLLEVEKRFNLYKTEGMTENWENYNWFGRPRWTEPCAVIDSYIAAIELWRFTGKNQYIEDAQLILYNGMESEQRWNGGYGCNSCLGNHDPYKEPGNEMFLNVATDESHWCCTMRGGEGLAKAVEYSYFTQGDTIFVPDFRSSDAALNIRSGRIELIQRAGYPFNEGVRLNINELNAGESPIFKFFIPSWLENIVVTVNNTEGKYHFDGQFLVLDEDIAGGDEIVILFDQEFSVKKPQNIHTIEGYHSFWYGPLMLGVNTSEELFIPEDAKIVKTGEREFLIDSLNIELTTLNHLMSPMVKKEHNYNFQGLFTAN